MLTRIDHVMICVPELSAGIEAYRRIGFDIHPGGAHAGGGTHNAIAFHDADYLELLSPRPGAPAPAPGSSEARLAEFLGRGPGSATSPSRVTISPPTWPPCAGGASEVSVDPVAGGRTTRRTAARLAVGRAGPTLPAAHLLHPARDAAR